MQIKRIFRTLEKVHQPTMLELLGNYKPFQLLVMTSLSARSKDSTLIPIVKEMFAKYPNPEDFVKINIKELEKIIFKIGFYRTKSKHIKELSKIIISQYHGKIPEAFEDLISLPGVGRKTANCILNYAFRKPAIAVDVHVHRISNRLGWIKTKTPEETEEALKKIVPKEEWINVNKLLVGHGQTICSPIKPNCPKCSINSYCDYNR